MPSALSRRLCAGVPLERGLQPELLAHLLELAVQLRGLRVAGVQGLRRAGGGERGEGSRSLCCQCVSLHPVQTSRNPHDLLDKGCRAVSGYG